MLQLPKFVLNHKGTASGSSTPKQQTSRSPSRAQSRPSGYSSATPSGLHGSLSIDPMLTWQSSGLGFRSPNSATPTISYHQQQCHEALKSPSLSDSSSGGGRRIHARRSKSFNSLDGCWAQNAPVTAAVVSRPRDGSSKQPLPQQQQHQGIRSKSAGRGLISAANVAAVGLKQ